MWSLTSAIPLLLFTSSSAHAQATFLYPVNTPTVNNIDTIDVAYTTQWLAANLTIFCQTSSVNYAFYAVNSNPSETTL
jgi:hypothetical protein